jgi:hypothetical protein
MDSTHDAVADLVLRGEAATVDEERIATVVAPRLR